MASNARRLRLWPFIPGAPVTTQDISLLDAIYTTRAIRKFADESVPLELVAKVIEAATQAPSPLNFQPWRFVVVDDPELKERIAEFYRASYFPRRANWAPEDLDEARNSSAFLANHMGEAPVLVLACGPAINRNPDPNALTMSMPGSVFPAVQNLLLAARAYGLGGVLTVNHEPFVPQIRELLGIPERYYVYSIIPLGFAAERHGKKTRQPVEAVSFYNHWDTPLAEQ
jgi:nitroreductase